MSDLKTSQVARELGTDRATVCDLIHAGKLPGAYRLEAHTSTGHGHWRIPQRALDIYRANQRHRIAS